MPSTLNCPNCSAPLDLDSVSATTMRCPYCNTSIIVPEEIRDRNAPSGSAVYNQITQAELESKLRFIKEAAMAGNKLVAVRAMRDTFPLSLKQASDLVDAIQRSEHVDLHVVQALSSTSQQSVSLDPAATQQILDLIRSGDRINAIKEFRQVTGVGLKQAKDAIDGMAVAISASPSERSHDEILKPSPPIITSNGSLIPVKSKRATKLVLPGVVLFFVLIVIVPILIGMASSGGPLAGTWARINPFAPGTLTLSFGSEGSGPGYFTDARYVEVDNNGHIFVGEYNGGRIQVFDENGKYQTQWIAKGVESGDIYLTGMAAGRDGAVYTVVGSQLYVYDGMNGNLLGQLEHPDGWGFDDVTVAPDGTITAAWYKNRDDIIRFTRSGEISLLVESAISNVTDDSELDMKVAVDGTGKIYTLAYFNEGVFVFSPDGRFITRFGSEGDAEGQFTSPRSIAIDNLGRVFIADFPGVMIYASDGRYLDTLAVNGAVMGMTFDDQNNLYLVADEQVMRYKLK